jgi:hypothetical protein
VALTVPDLSGVPDFDGTSTIVHGAAASWVFTAVNTAAFNALLGAANWGAPKQSASRAQSIFAP